MLLNILKLNQRVKLSEIHFSEIREGSGETCFTRIYGKDLITLSDEIEENILRKSPFVRTFGSMFDYEKVVLFFRKAIHFDLIDTVKYLNIVYWYCGKVVAEKPDRVEFVSYHSPFNGLFKNFAREHFNIEFKSSLALKKIFDFLYSLCRSLVVSAYFSLIPIVNAFTKYRLSVPPNTGRQKPMIMNAYSLQKITFDPADRSNFPWLVMSDIPRDQVMVYFETPNVAAIDDMVREFDKHGIQYLAVSRSATRSTKMPVFTVGKGVTSRILANTFRVVLLTFRSMVCFDAKILAYLPHVVHFIREHATAYDLFLRHNVKIYIDYEAYNPRRIARHIALKENGGVSICYQMSHMPIANVGQGTGVDIHFIFGPYYYPRLKYVGSVNDVVLSYGYIADFSFKPAGKRSKIVREQLKRNGVKFIVAYFDENSSDDRMSVLPDKRSRMIYERLLNWVSTDPEMGLLCSPKFPNTLLKRMPEVEDSIKAAEKTGRCLFMKGLHNTQNYPNEIGQMSDIAISLLIGGTTCLENLLAGVRVVSLDLEGFYSFPEYTWGRDTIVFDDLEKLISAIDRFRRDRKNVDELGNPMNVPTLSKKDPFRDGNAARRMGQYVHCLLEMFDNGESRQQAIAYANSKYAENWGIENVMECC